MIARWCLWAALCATLLPTRSDAWDGSQTLEPGLNGADLLLVEDFEAADFGARWSTHWGDPPGPDTISSPSDDVFDGTRSLLLQGQQGEHESIGSGEYVPETPEGNQAYYRLYLRLQDGFSMGSCNQLKLFGIRGGTAIEDAYGGAGTKPTGSDKFSALLGIHNAMDLHFYYYHPDQSGIYGDNTDCDETGAVATLAPGRWHCLELMLKLNQPGSSDGQLRAWIDDELVGKVDGIRFRDTVDLKIRRFTVLSYFGGSGAKNTSPVDQQTFVDNVVISRERVGCFSASLSPDAGPSADSGATDSRVDSAASDSAEPSDAVASDAADSLGGDSPSTADDGCSCQVVPSSSGWLILFALVAFIQRRIRSSA